MLLLDLFCGIGGAAMGYSRAGFDIIGVDKLPQPEYPFPMYRADAIEFAQACLLEENAMIGPTPVAAIHASPPCKRFSTLSKSLGYDSHTDLLTPIREILTQVKIPWIIENVPGAPMRNPMILCGSMFDLRIEEGYLQRHRLFESNIRLLVPGPCKHEFMRSEYGIKAIGVYGNGRGGGELKNRTANADQARRLMGIDWAGRAGIAQAVPPAYTEYLGGQLLAYINSHN